MLMSLPSDLLDGILGAGPSPSRIWSAPAASPARGGAGGSPSPTSTSGCPGAPPPRPTSASFGGARRQSAASAPTSTSATSTAPPAGSAPWRARASRSSPSSSMSPISVGASPPRMASSAPPCSPAPRSYASTSCTSAATWRARRGASQASSPNQIRRGVKSFEQSSKRNRLEGITWKFESLREAHLSANSAIRSSILSAENSGWPEDEIDEDFLNSQMSDNLFASLKHVSVSGTTHSSNQICFLKFLLSKTESLQSFVLTFCFYESNK